MPTSTNSSGLGSALMAGGSTFGLVELLLVSAAFRDDSFEATFNLGSGITVACPKEKAGVLLSAALPNGEVSGLDAVALPKGDDAPERAKGEDAPASALVAKPANADDVGASVLPKVVGVEGAKAL